MTANRGKILGIYPGTFDPITLGHMDLIQRASRLFDELIIAVVDIQSNKQACLSTQERVRLVKAATQDFSNIRVESFSGLLITYAKAHGINYVIRGLRNIQDFEYEGQLSGMNKSLMPELETIFLFTDPKYAHISSSTVREVGRLGGDISSFVPEAVTQAGLLWR